MREVLLTRPLLGWNPVSNNHEFVVNKSRVAVDDGVSIRL
jgi:hypothetical protein